MPRHASSLRDDAARAQFGKRVRRRVLDRVGDDEKPCVAFVDGDDECRLGGSGEFEHVAVDGGEGLFAKLRHITEPAHQRRVSNCNLLSADAALHT